MLTVDDFEANGFTRRQFMEWELLARDIGLKEAFLERCCHHPKTESDAFHPVTCGKDSEVYRFEFEGRSFFFKEFLSRGWQDRIKDMFRDTRAVRAFRGELILTEAGLNAPPILLIGERTGSNFMVTEEIPDATNLYFMVTEPEKYPLPPHQFAKQLGELIGTLHANGISHGDLRWGNILWNGTGESLAFYFIDNERTVKYSRLPDRVRFKNLVQMAMSADHLTTYHVLRFFVAYLRKNPELIQHKREWLKRVHAKAEERRERARLRSASR